jgi:hypothetical protein
VSVSVNVNVSVSLRSSELRRRVPASKSHKDTGTYIDLYQDAQGSFPKPLRTFEVARVWKAKGSWQAKAQGARGEQQRRPGRPGALKRKLIRPGHPALFVGIFATAPYMSSSLAKKWFRPFAEPREAEEAVFKNGSNLVYLLMQKSIPK